MPKSYMTEKYLFWLAYCRTYKTAMQTQRVLTSICEANGIPLTPDADTLARVHDLACRSS